jgi:hypothetical protein
MSEAAVVEGVPTTSITVQGLSFDAPQPYKSGPRELTEGEASALNQTLAENLRNNFAPKVKLAMEEYRKANGLAEDAEVGVDQLDHDSLVESFDKYADEYEFGIRRAGGGVRAPANPVEREAIRIATSKVREALKKKGLKLDSVSKERMAEFVQSVLTKYPDIREEAKRRVEATQAVAVEDLEL